MSNGDIVIEYAVIHEAEIANRNGTVYENTPMKLEWYEDWGVEEFPRSSGVGLSARHDSNDATEFET